MLIKNLETESDIQATAQLYCEIWKEPPWNEDFWKPEEVVRDIKTQLTKPNAIFLIATNGTDEVIGFTWGYQVSTGILSEISGVSVEDWRKVISNKEVFYIDEFGTKRSYRRKGIGTKLVRELLEQLSHTDIKLTTLRTNKSALPARAIYSQMGFQEIGIQDTKHQDRTYWMRTHK